MKKDEKKFLRNGCQIIQMQLEAAKEVSQSEYWKMINSIIRSITPNIKVGDNHED